MGYLAGEGHIVAEGYVAFVILRVIGQEPLLAIQQEAFVGGNIVNHRYPLNRGHSLI